MKANNNTSNADEVIEKLAALASIQAERQRHDAQTKDQTKPAKDILDKAAK